MKTETAVAVKPSKINAAADAMRAAMDELKKSGNVLLVRQLEIARIDLIAATVDSSKADLDGF